MTQVDWIPILTKLLGPQCIELSHPPEKIVFCMGAISHNVIAEEATIGTAAPFKVYDFVSDVINDFKIQKSNGGGSGRTIAAQILTEKKKAALRALAFTDEENSKQKPEVIQRILASYCADPGPGFECLPPCDRTSPAHRKAIIEFWSEGLEEYEGIESKITFDHPAPAARFKVDHIDLPAAGDPSAIHIPPALKLECVKLDDGVEKNSPGLAAAVREACAVYARTGPMLYAALI